MVESNESKEKQYKNFLSIVFILVLVVSVVGITYSVFSYSKTGTKENAISTGAITCSLNEDNAIAISSAHPISDATGKMLSVGSIAGYSQGYFDSTLTCTCSGPCNGSYELYAKEENSETAIDGKYVRTYLTDGANTETTLMDVASYDSITTANADIAGKKLYEGSISSNFSQKFRLRLWLYKDEDGTEPDNSYVVDGTSRSFNLKLYAKVTA